MTRLIAVLVLAGASVKAQTYTSGEWQYTVSNGEANITGYTGSGGVVTIPSNLNGIPVKSIGNPASWVNWNPSSPVTSVNVSEGITRVGQTAFYYLSSLTNISLPDGLTSIGNQAFRGCIGLTSITIPQGVTILDEAAFYECSNLTNITIPTSITTLGKHVFGYCSGLVKISIPSGVTSIGVAAFRGCTSLTNITIPASLTNLAGQTFIDCTNLTEVIFLGNAPPVLPVVDNEYGSDPEWIGSAATIFHSVEATGWGPSFAGRPVRPVPAGVIYSLGETIKYLRVDPVAGLYNQSQYDANRNNGQADILNNPNANGLYTTNQIHNLGLGGIVLNRNTNNQLVLNYQVLQSSDLQSWSPYQQTELVISNAPSDKMFLRVQAVGQ